MRGYIVTFNDRGWQKYQERQKTIYADLLKYRHGLLAFIVSDDGTNEVLERAQGGNAEVVVEAYLTSDIAALHELPGVIDCIEIRR